MPEYRCSECGRTTDREGLTVKRVQWTTMGAGYKTLKSRTVAWLCTACRIEDPAWQQPPLVSAPGNRGDRHGA